jgi:hypothetical protein
LKTQIKLFFNWKNIESKVKTFIMGLLLKFLASGTWRHSKSVSRGNFWVEGGVQVLE